MITSKTYAAPPIDEREVLRYAGCREADAAVSDLLKNCIREAEGVLTYRVVWRTLPLTVQGEECDLGALRVRSRDLAARLGGCQRVILFAATVGVGIDRLIAKYGRLSPSRALMFQAIGAERIEALCDVFCTDMARQTGAALTPRFSPGYGDLPLTAQRDIFAALACHKHIGLTLTDSLLMSPTKSVTALAGITDGAPPQAANPCSACHSEDCCYRSDI